MARQEVPLSWVNTHRNPKVVEKVECVMCGENETCFSFSGGDGTYDERICRECLLVAARLLLPEVGESGGSDA